MRIPPLFIPGFDWIQVEVTTYCNAACIYCPRTVYKKSWTDRHLSLDLFLKIKPVFSKTRYLHLQGWGEPFLNPDFFKMISIAKKEGLKIGTTTNAMLIDQEIIIRLLDSGIDLVAFSLAGLEEASNDSIRKGTRFSKVMKVIESLAAEKAKRQSRSPDIHVAYLMVPAKIKELEKLPALLSEVGVNQVVLSTLDFVASEELGPLVFQPSSFGEYRETESFLQSVSQEGERRGLSVHYYLPPFDRQGPERLLCTENVQKVLCLASDGAVTPCVFTNLQVKNEFHYPADGKRAYQRMIFGNIETQSPFQIWQNRSYKKFRSSFSKNNLDPICRICPKLGKKS